MKQRPVSFFLNLCIFFGVITISSAQAPDDAFKKMASMPLQSPQAASLSKYVEFPVSYYSGLAQVSFPIYEIKTGDISVPISLSYHGGGIKVQEEASWVGLGWTLNAGGVITHEIKGDDDEYGFNHQFNKVLPFSSQNQYTEGSNAFGTTNASNIYNNIGTAYNNADLYNTLQGGTMEAEPDLYCYTFGSYSGKFFSAPGGFVDVSRNNIKFERSNVNGFNATTPDGYIYTFDVIEKAWSYPVQHATNTAYYLSKIISPKGKVVNFYYKSFKQMIDDHDQSGQENWRNQFPNLGSGLGWGNDGTILQLPSLSEHYFVYTLQSYSGNIPAPSAETPGQHQSYSTTYSTNYYLDKISFDIGFVDFAKSPRSDLYGVKLDAVKIHKSDLSLVKSIPFSYDYFTSNRPDDDNIYDRINRVKYLGPYSADVDIYPVDFRKKRLKLLNVGIETSPHTFQYEEGNSNSTLPYKTSFSQDFWGYYNGKVNYTLIPSYDLYSQKVSIPSALSSWGGGANRDPDKDFITAGNLQKITYPTGGYSEFSYEMNKFSNLTRVQQNVYEHAQPGGVDAGPGTKEFYFTLSEETHCDIVGGLYCNGMGDMGSSSYNCGGVTSLANGLYAYIEKVDPDTHASFGLNVNWTFDISNSNVRNAGGVINMQDQVFSAGTYRITVNYPDYHNPGGSEPNNRRAELYVSFYQPISQSNTTLTGSGLRVKSIRQFDPLSLQSTERQFNYVGGKIMHYPLFCSRTSMSVFQRDYAPWGDWVDSQGDYLFYYMYSTPSTPYSFSANGSSGGYDSVTETIIGAASIGKTLYEYKNRPDPLNSDYAFYLPGVPTTGYLDNGFLKRVSITDRNNVLQKETINEAMIGLAQTYWPFKGRKAVENRSGDVNGLDDVAAFQNFYQYSFYPVQVGKLLSTKTTENNYASGTSITSVKDFSYNENGFLRQEQSNSSNGNNLTTNYRYASDYINVNSDWIEDLKDRNMIGIPLEVYGKRNGLVTGGSFTTYSKHDNIITPNEVYKIETAYPKNISSTAPNGTIPAELKLSGTLTFDANGNLIQSKANNNIYTSYLYGYSQNYPVAQITGVDYSSVDALISNGTVSQQILDNTSSTDEQIRQQLSNLRVGLAGTKALVSTYTYKPLVGMSSQTDTKGLTTFYNYDYDNRLANIKDEQGQILKSNDYVYSPALKNIVNNLHYNAPITRVFNKTCPVDAWGRIQIGPDVPYTVSAGRYAALTLQEANAKAQADINANGPANADLAGGECYLYGGPLTLETIYNGAGDVVSIKYKCSFWASYVQLFIKDVETGALVHIGPYTLSVGQTNFSTTVPKGKQYEFWLQAGGPNYSNTPNYQVQMQPFSIFLP